MTVQLQNATTSLQALSQKLTIDADIQSELNGIVVKGRQVSENFSDAVFKEGSEILRQKQLLVRANSANDVTINDMQVALNAARAVLGTARSDVITMQTFIHTNIETCRERKLRHETEIATKQASLELIANTIVDIDGRAQTFEQDATELDGVATNLDNRAGDLRRSAKRKKKNSWIGIAVGVVLAPLTGGASLVAGAAYAGVNMNDADDCNRKAGKSRQDAANKRQEAQNLRNQKQGLVNQKSALEMEIASLSAQKDKLTEASTVLDTITGSLQSSLQVFDIVIVALQDTDTALKDAQMQSDSFKIIQTALAKGPERLEATSQKHLDLLKDKWERLEHTLVQYGARPFA